MKENVTRSKPKMPNINPSTTPIETEALPLFGDCVDEKGYFVLHNNKQAEHF